MKQGELFSKTRRELPKDEQFKSAQYLIRAGFINKEMAGVYSMLPLGLRVMRKIENIIRDEMNALGANEIQMTALQDSEIWKKTDRWGDEKVDIWFKTTLKNGTEIGLGNTHEEAIANMLKNHIHSHKDLPTYVYQFQNKFRNELRAKNGIMRGREFLMKDLYSFSLNKEQHDVFYNRVEETYTRIFEKVGLGDKTFKTFASGGIFAKFSHEYQTLCEAGEDLIYYGETINQVSGEKEIIAINKELFENEEDLQTALNETGLDRNKLIEAKAIEVGNIFTLGTRYSEPLELIVDDGSGNRVPVFMGSYGIGIGRLMGTIAEVYSDNKGLVWPEEVAPFKYHLINLLPSNEEAVEAANKLYEKMNDVLYDDTDRSIGAKMSDSDLIGIPTRIIIGKNFLESGELEINNRITGETKNVNPKDFTA